MQTVGELTWVCQGGVQGMLFGLFGPGWTLYYVKRMADRPLAKQSSVLDKGSDIVVISATH